MAVEIKSFTPEFEEYLRDESRHCGNAEAIVFAKSEADVREALGESDSATILGARTGIAAMRQIKEYFDPGGILNPGNLLTLEKKQ